MGPVHHMMHRASFSASLQVSDLSSTWLIEAQVNSGIFQAGKDFESKPWHHIGLPKIKLCLRALSEQFMNSKGLGL